MTYLARDSMVPCDQRSVDYAMPCKWNLNGIDFVTCLKQCNLPAPEVRDLERSMSSFFCVAPAKSNKMSLEGT